MLVQTSVAGIATSGWILAITPTKQAGNVTTIQTNPDGSLTVTHNGQSVTIPSGQVFTLNYSSSVGGGDSFVNNSSLTEYAIFHGGNSTHLGGSNWNTVFMYGDNNTFDSRTAPSYVFVDSTATGNNIVPYPFVNVFRQTTAQ